METLILLFVLITVLIFATFVFGSLFYFGLRKKSSMKKEPTSKPSFFEWEKHDKLIFSWDDEEITVWLDSFFGDEIVVFTTKKQNKFAILRWDEKLECFTDGENELDFIENSTLIDRQQTRRLNSVRENHKLLKDSINEIKSIDEPIGNYINYEDTIRNSTN